MSLRKTKQELQDQECIRMHTFYKYTVDLNGYIMQEIPQAVTLYRKEYERSLSTEIKRFQRELNWKDMWTIKDARERLSNGWTLVVLRPLVQIKGWVWLAPDGEIKNLYVSKRKRGFKWGRNLIEAAMNQAWVREFEKVYWRIDLWNNASKYVFESVLSKISCKSDVRIVEEEY